MRTQFFGEIRVDSIPEYEFALEGGFFLRGMTPEIVAEHEHWLGPRHVEPGTRRLKMISHSYLIRTPHHTILFDTCCGNHKEAPGLPWHQLRTPFLDNLAKAGVKPEDVNYVMCSHFHGDHYGWNTRLHDGHWVPTFPNARYLISKGEYEFWRSEIESGKAHAMRLQPWTESMLPIVERGLATFVEDTHGFEDEMPDEIRYMPLYGHTKHHCGLYLRHGTKDAIFPGDGIQHAIQLARPDIVGGYDPKAATQVIHDLISRCIDTPTMILTAHFPSPTAGRIVSEKGNVRFKFDE